MRNPLKMLTHILFEKSHVKKWWDVSSSSLLLKVRVMSISALNLCTSFCKNRFSKNFPHKKACNSLLPEVNINRRTHWALLFKLISYPEHSLNQFRMASKPEPEKLIKNISVSSTNCKSVICHPPSPTLKPSNLLFQSSDSTLPWPMKAKGW